VTDPDDTIPLDREDANELAESIRCLGSWLYRAPEDIRRNFTRHAFPDATAPGANPDDFLLPLHHAWQHLREMLDERPEDERATDSSQVRPVEFARPGTLVIGL
jgi:hypothetical protein